MFNAGILSLFQFSLLGVYLGIARSAIESVVELANEKTPNMRPSKLRESQVAQQRIGQAEALRLSALSMLERTCRILEERLSRDGVLTPRDHALRQMTGAQVARDCSAAVDIAYEVAGTTGVFEGHKLERCFRDMHVATQHMGVSPGLFTMAGLTLLNEAATAPVT